MPPPTDAECQEAVYILIRMVQGQTDAPGNPRRVVEMWERAGACDARHPARPAAARQAKYRGDLGPELYARVCGGAEPRAALSSSDTHRVSRATARNFGADLDALYPLLSPAGRASLRRDDNRSQR